MRPVDIKSINYMDNLARERRRRFVLWLGLSLVILMSTAGGLVYLLFFSRSFDIRDITLNGLKTVDSSLVTNEIQSVLESRKFRYLKTQKDILFFNEGNIKQKLMAALPILKDIKI